MVKKYLRVIVCRCSNWVCGFGIGSLFCGVLLSVLSSLASIMLFALLYLCCGRMILLWECVPQID